MLPVGRKAIELPVRNSNSVLAVLPPFTGDVDLSADCFLLQLFEKRHDFLARLKIAPDRQIRKSFIHDYNDVRVGDGGSCTCALVFFCVSESDVLTDEEMLRIDRFRIGLEIRFSGERFISVRNVFAFEYIRVLRVLGIYFVCNLRCLLCRISGWLLNI